MKFPRFERRVAANLKLSGIPARKTLDAFDFDKSCAAREKNRLHILRTTLLRADLFVLDEVGFQPHERDDATLLFEAINKRYDAHKSMIVTSNKSFGHWHEIFPDPVLAVALLDRLLHHSTTLNIRGDSYRLRHRQQTGLPQPNLPEGPPM